MTQNNEREKLDVRYFNEKLRLVLEGLPNYTRSELARELQRLSNTASPISQNEQQPKQIPEGCAIVNVEDLINLAVSYCEDGVHPDDLERDIRAMLNAAPNISLTSETNTEVGDV